MGAANSIVLALAGAALVANAALAHDHPHGYQAGQPGDARQPARKIEVTVSDADGRMRFTPARVEVAKGEQVQFVVHNAGQLTHEFVLGSKAENAAHGRMMAAMPDMKHNDPNAVTIPAGQTATISWRFTRKGAFEFACLIPGHYEAGMHGAVTVK